MSPELPRLLQQDGLCVAQVASPEALRGACERHSPLVAVILLDSDAPIWWAALGELHARHAMPIVALLGSDSDSDVIAALNAGATVSLRAGHPPVDMARRILALARTPLPPTDGQRDIRVLGGIVMDVGRREVRAGDQLVDLTRIEFDILELILRPPRVVLSRSQIIQGVWGPDWFGDEHLVDSHVSKVRRKIGDTDPERRLIETVRGVGFRASLSG